MSSFLGLSDFTCEVLDRVFLDHVPCDFCLSFRPEGSAPLPVLRAIFHNF